MANYLLGVDNGCTVAKAALFTLDGRELAAASRKVASRAPRPGWAEVDMCDSWAASAASIRTVLTQAAVDPRDIACVACTGHGNGLYLVDRQGHPLRPGILSTDSRARSYVDGWLAAGVDKAVRPKTMQNLWAGQPNALLAWLRDHESEVLGHGGWVLMCKDYIRFRLTGQIAAELTDASGTSLLNVPAADYDPAVLEAFGLAEFRDWLPPLVRSAEVCGAVTAAAAAETGLAAGTPVAGGVFDIDACALGSGVVDERLLCMSAGTWGCNQYVAAQPVVADDVFMTSCFAVPGHYLMFEGSPTSAGNLEWFVSEFFAAEGVQAAAQGRSVYELCDTLVAHTEPSDSRIVYLPYLYGSSAQAAAKACFIGLAHWHHRGHVLRAIYEGVAFAHREHVERLLRFRPMPASIRLTGGAARSRPWLEIFADVFQVPVEVPAGTELGALGAALCAGVAAGCHASFPAAAGAMVRIERRQVPAPGRRDHYEAKYAYFRRVQATLGPVWENE